MGQAGPVHRFMLHFAIDRHRIVGVHVIGAYALLIKLVVAYVHALRSERLYWLTFRNIFIIIIECIFITSCVLFYCTVCTAVLHILVAGLPARSQYPESPATGHLDTGFSWFSCLKADAEIIPKTPSCYYMLLM